MTDKAAGITVTDMRTTFLVAVVLCCQPAYSKEISSCNAECIATAYAKQMAKARAESGRDAWRASWVIGQAMDGGLFVALPDGSVYSHETRKILRPNPYQTTENKALVRGILKKWELVENADFNHNLGGFLYFRNYRCEWDCSGHKAGYEWARTNHIEEYDGCQGDSQAFVEGCRVRVADERLEVFPPN